MNLITNLRGGHCFVKSRTRRNTGGKITTFKLGHPVLTVVYVGACSSNVSVRMVWISFGALPCRKKKTWWQIASRCCWNRARRLTCFLSTSVTRKTCNSAHEQTPLSTDTIDSVLRHREVGRSKDLSAPPRMYKQNLGYHDVCVCVCVCAICTFISLQINYPSAICNSAYLINFPTYFLQQILWTAKIINVATPSLLSLHGFIYFSCKFYFLNPLSIYVSLWTFL